MHVSASLWHKWHHLNHQLTIVNARDARPLMCCIFAMQKRLTFSSTKNTSMFQIFMFEILTKLRGWSSGAMVLGQLPVPGRPTILITVGQGPTAHVVGAGGGCLDIFTLIYPFFPLSPSLWETARYRLKYCLKGPLNPKPTNQPINKTSTNDIVSFEQQGPVH